MNVTLRATVPRRRPGYALPAVVFLTLVLLGAPIRMVQAEEAVWSLSPGYLNALRGLATVVEPARSGPTRMPARPSRDPAARRVQYAPSGTLTARPVVPPRSALSAYVADPPIDYSGPHPSTIDDVDARDGPHIPEPMVFDLVRGLGARRGELEINVLNLVPLHRRGPRYEWAPEIEYVLFDGFAVEFELPIFDTTIVATKYAAQYTFGTAFDNAFIHGVQGILFHDIQDSELAVAVLYLAGLRLDRHWSLFLMMGLNFGPQVFPFDDVPPRRGTDILINPTIFYNVNDRLVLGVETNLLRRIEGSGDLLIIPQFHYHVSDAWTVQFGVGLRDTFVDQYPELGFRVIWER